MTNAVNNIDIDNHTDLEFDYTLISKITTDLTNKEIELIICDNSYIQDLNRQYRNIDKPTDVLSFPLEDMAYSPLGTIVISVDFVKDLANTLGHSVDDEFALLYIHGLLHLLGYDHEVDSGQHRQKEQELIEKHNLPNSLIHRNEDI